MSQSLLMFRSSTSSSAAKSTNTRRRRMRSESISGSSGAMVRSENVGMDITALEEEGEDPMGGDDLLDEGQGEPSTSPLYSDRSSKIPPLYESVDEHPTSLPYSGYRPDTNLRQPSSLPREVTDESEASDGSTKLNQPHTKSHQPSSSSSSSSSSPENGPQYSKVAQLQSVAFMDGNGADYGGQHSFRKNETDILQSQNTRTDTEPLSPASPAAEQQQNHEQQCSIPSSTLSSHGNVDEDSGDCPCETTSSSKSSLPKYETRPRAGNHGRQQHRKKHPQPPEPPPPPQVEPLDISYTSTPASVRLKEVLLSRLSIASPMGRIQVIDLSRRGLVENDVQLICAAMRANPQLAVLKLGYNCIGDRGASMIASSSSTNGRHHQNLTVLDLGFNSIGDEGCTALSLNMLAGNHTLRSLFLSGNQITEKGGKALAGAILHGCSLSRLHVSANRLGPDGIKILAQSIAEAEARVQHLLQRQGGIKLGYCIKPVTLEELGASDVGIDAVGCATLSSMIMTNFNIKTLALANNSLDDHDMALLSQALAQNKEMPLESLILSFNKISCVGVECLMNAVWGSHTLKEIKLDNNRMQDRGAQLCSVVLGSIKLEVLDVSFNLISTVGIKAIMKSLSENDSLQRLGMCGVLVDQNASKALSYAVAYNQSLVSLNIDSCNIGYSGQRHIVAGVVSNRNVKLRALTGFPLGPITMTLGLPQLPEDWGNDRVLSFVRFMWAQWQRSLEEGMDTSKDLSRGPAPPSMVASSAKAAFLSLSQSDEAKIQFQSEHQSEMDHCPLIAPDTSILVRSNSGNNLQVPSWDIQHQEAVEEAEHDFAQDSWSSETESLDRSSYTGSSQSLQNIAAVDHERRNKNLGWLRAHLQALNEVGTLAFNNADLWQLHQYFFSPAYTADDDLDLDDFETSDDKGEKMPAREPHRVPTGAPPPTPVPSEADKPGFGRAISFQTLGKAAAKAAADEAKGPNKRGSLEEEQPIAKRPKHLKPRIAFYPRIQEKLESLGTKPSTQTLSLLRRLKYVESVMLNGRNVYADYEPTGDDFGTRDAEMVLMDLL